MKGQPKEGREGVISLAMQQVFEYIAGCEDHAFLLRVSYIEIYSQSTETKIACLLAVALSDACSLCFSDERVKDLLSSSSGPDLVIHESKQRGGAYVNSKEEIVSSAADVLRIIEAGEARRHYGTTAMNDLSSRSHTILRLIIESNPISDLSASFSSPRATPKAKRTKPKVKISTLNFVDRQYSSTVQHCAGLDCCSSLTC